MTDPDIHAGLEYAITIVETFAAGTKGSSIPHSDVREATANEIIECLRYAMRTTPCAHLLVNVDGPDDKQGLCDRCGQVVPA